MGLHNSVSKYILRSPRFNARKKISKRTLHNAQTGKLVLSQKTLTVTLLGMLVLSGVFYLMLVNSRVSKSFKIDELSQKATQLKRENTQLETKAANLQSIQNIQKSLNLENYVPTTDVSYLNEQDYAVLDTRGLQ